MSSIFVNHVNKITPIHDSVLVAEMNFHERISNGGIIIPGDDARNRGIRPRWGRVFAIGPEQQDVKVGQWICGAHGRWTRGVTIEDQNGQHTIRRVDNNDILLVSDEAPLDDTISDN